MGYDDPNNGRPRLSSAQLGRIIEGYNQYLVDMENNNEEFEDDGSGLCERVDGVEDGITTVSDQEMEGGRGSRGVEIEVEQSEVGEDGAGEQVEGERSDQDDLAEEYTNERLDSERNGEQVNSGGSDENMDYTDDLIEEVRNLPSFTETLVPGGAQQSKCVEDMQELLKRCVICDDDEIATILAFVKQIHNWEEFVHCINLACKKVSLYPDDILPEKDQSTTRKHNVEVSVRCDVPSAVLKEGWEPVKVLGDGNCFFRAVSKTLTGSDDDHNLLKLAAIAHGCANEDYFMKNCLHREDLDLFLHTITDEEVLGGIDDSMCDEEKFVHVYRQEVMKSSVDGRYSGYLQVLLMAGAIQKRILQYCNAPGFELYNSEINPPNVVSNVSVIRILWCSLGGNATHPNHIVPLMKCVDGGFNTFSKAYKGLCGAESFCQFNKDEESGKRVQWVACDSCLRWFHVPCVAYCMKQTFSKHWFCGCKIPENEIWQRDYSPSVVGHFCEDAQLKNFVQELIAGKFKSRRMTYLRSAERSTASSNLLKNCNGFGVLLEYNKSVNLIVKKEETPDKDKTNFSG